MRRLRSSVATANDASYDLKQFLLRVVVAHLIALGWNPLMAELEVHLRMREHRS